MKEKDINSLEHTKWRCQYQSRRKYICDEGSDRKLTFHGLRHTCAVEWYRKFVENGLTDHQAKLRVSKLLGHEREDVTRIYLAFLNISDKH